MEKWIYWVLLGVAIVIVGCIVYRVTISGVPTFGNWTDDDVKCGPAHFASKDPKTGKVTCIPIAQPMQSEKNASEKKDVR